MKGEGNIIYRKVCLIPEMADAGMVHNQLEAYGLHPLPLNISAHVTIAGADQYYYIELPEEEIEKGQKVLSDIGKGKCLI